MALEQWAQKVLVATAGDNPLKTIQLGSDGLIWETWSAPFPDTDEFIVQAKAVISAFAEECPKNKRVPLLFSAFGADGAITSQCPSSVIGKNAQADAMVGAGGGTAKAYAEAMSGLTATMNAINKAAKDMLENAMRANDSLTQQLVDLREYNDALQEEVIRQKQNESGTSEFLMQQLKDASPLALEALGMFLESHKTKATGAVAKAVVTGINQVTNGAS